MTKFDILFDLSFSEENKSEITITLSLCKEKIVDSETQAVGDTRCIVLGTNLLT